MVYSRKQAKEYCMFEGNSERGGVKGQGGERD